MEIFLMFGYNRPNSRARAYGFGAPFNVKFAKDFLIVHIVTVTKARKSRSAISRFESPWAMSWRISNSALAQWIDKGPGRG